MRFILGFITSWIVFIGILVGAYFYFDVSSYTFMTQDNKDELQQQADYNKGQQAKQQEVIQENQTQETQQTHQQHATAKIEPKERKNNLNNTNKAYKLMESDKEDLSEQEQAEYDAVIKTAKRNINEGVGNEEDKAIVEKYNNNNDTPQ